MAPGQMGGHKPKAIAARITSFWRGGSGRAGCTLRGWWRNSPSAASRSTIDRCGTSCTPNGSLTKKTVVASDAIARTSRGDAPSGHSGKVGLIPSAWCSSTKPGPRRTWRRCGLGRAAIGLSRTPVVIASEARQSSDRGVSRLRRHGTTRNLPATPRSLDCFAPLAMTVQGNCRTLSRLTQISPPERQSWSAGGERAGSATSIKKRSSQCALSVSPRRSGLKRMTMMMATATTPPTSASAKP